MNPALDAAPTMSITPTMNVTGTLAAETQLAISSGFAAYVRQYEEHVADLVFQGGVKVPAQDYSTFLSIQDPRRLLFMYSILSTGARMSGHWKPAQDYFLRARFAKPTNSPPPHLASNATKYMRRNLMSELYDDSSALVAATHALFAYHYGSLGDIDKASYANALALRILEHLLRTRPHEKAKDGVHYATLYLHSLMIEIDVTPTLFVDPCCCTLS
jgi:hypothetical protein